MDHGNKGTIDSLKQQENLAEFIYVQLDEFSKNTSIDNLFIFDQIISNLWRKPENKKEQTAKVYLHVNYGYYLKQFGFINKSIKQYEQAYSIYKTNGNIDFDIIEFCLKPLANNYTRLGEINRAEDILKILIQKAQQVGNIGHVSSGYLNLASVYRTKGNYHKAIEYLKLGLKLENSPGRKSAFYSDLAINYMFLDEVDLTFENIKKSNKLNSGLINSILVRNLISEANWLLKKGEFEKALDKFYKSIEKARLVFGEHNREVAKIYNQVAVVYRQKKMFEMALEAYQKSLTTLLIKFKAASLLENPNESYFYPENTLKEALDGRGDVFVLINNFNNALENYKLAFIVDKELRGSYVAQNSKIVQQQESRIRSEKCIEICYVMFNETNDVNWIERGFQFAEHSKSIVLLDAKKEGFFKSKIKNDSLFLIENSLLLKKSNLNNNILLEELKGEKASIKLLSKFISERDNIFNNIQLTRNEIAKKYPQLNVQNDSLISLKKLKKEVLKNDTSLIEFFDGQNNIYIFSINNRLSIQVKKIIKDDVFQNQITDFLELFSKDSGVEIQNNIDNYTFLAHELYVKLFTTHLNSKVIIVPDGIFSFMPFDALLSEKTKIRNFGKLPYLIKTNNISYAYSAAIQIEQTKLERSTQSGFLGFFPVFKENHRKLAALNYTLEEARSIKEIRKGKFLLREKASKSQFQNLAKDNAIVHLSTHAAAGDYLNPPSIEFYDKSLYLPEIYGYNLNNDLLVLSACETGIGTLRKGEGLMSLARGFSFAGVKNLIVSLWKVNDKSTSLLMSSFYENLKVLGDKSLSLHKSKLDYLNNNSISNAKKSPFYWASFVYIGNTMDLSNDNFSLGWLIILGFVLLAGSFALKNSRFGLNK